MIMASFAEYLKAGRITKTSPFSITRCLPEEDCIPKLVDFHTEVDFEGQTTPKAGSTLDIPA